MKYVAFLDILGFKEKLKELDHNGISEYISDFSSVVYNEWENSEYKKLQGYIVSDSFVINSTDASEESLEELLGLVKRICEQEFAKNGILLRGGIAKGDFDKLEAKELSTLRKGLIVGQAYVDAYLLEGSTKLIGISLSKEVYEDVNNIGQFCSDLFKETLDGSSIYVFRYLTIDFLLNRENLKKFVKLATGANWKPHYYNAIYFAFRKESRENTVGLIFSNIIEEIKRYPTNNNWIEIDNFIKGAFAHGVIPEFQMRFLKYIRASLK